MLELLLVSLVSVQDIPRAHSAALRRTFLQGIVMVGLMRHSGWSAWQINVAIGLSHVVVDMVFMAFARRKLLTEFRETAAGD